MVALCRCRLVLSGVCSCSLLLLSWPQPNALLLPGKRHPTILETSLVGWLVSWLVVWLVGSVVGYLLPSSGRPLLGCWVGRSVSFLVVESVFNRWTVGLSLGHLVIVLLPILWEAFPVQLSLPLARLTLDQAARLRCTSLKSLPVFHNLFIFVFMESSKCLVVPILSWYFERFKK